MTKYYAQIVALTDDDEFDYDTYAAEFTFQATGEQLAHVVMPLASLEAGLDVSLATEALFGVDTKRRLANL